MADHRAVATVDEAIDSALSELGFSYLKDKQREAVTAFLKGNDCFISLPTGYDKSSHST